MVTCGTCRGRGAVIRTQRMGPMVQQFQSACSDCRGSGQSISDAARCKACIGRKIIEKQKVLELHVEKGMTDNQKINFREESDQAPDMDVSALHRNQL